MYFSQATDSQCSPQKKHRPNGLSRPPLLPPCRVCGDRASGYHYGVNTCEACKVQHKCQSSIPFCRYGSSVMHLGGLFKPSAPT